MEASAADPRTLVQPSPGRLRALVEVALFCAIFGAFMGADYLGGDALIAAVPAALRIPVQVFAMAQVLVVFCVACAGRDEDMARSLGLSRERIFRSTLLGVAIFSALMLAAAVIAWGTTSLVSIAQPFELRPELPPGLFDPSAPGGPSVSENMQVLRAFSEIPLPLVVPLALFIGFYEELCFRGFLLGRLRVLLGDTALAGALAVVASSIVFALGHMYKDGMGIGGTFVLSLIFGAVAWSQRRITACVVIHTLVDATALLAAHVVAGQLHGGLFG